MKSDYQFLHVPSVRRPRDGLVCASVHRIQGGAGGDAIGCWKSEALDVCGLPPLLHVDARLWGWENREIR